jgi:hypothetical protein
MPNRLNRDVRQIALLLLLTRAFPALALAYRLRGAYPGCRSLAQARATALGGGPERGLALIPVALSVGRIMWSPALLNAGPDSHCRVQ